MGIAEKVRQQQDIKEMTRRAIRILKKCGDDTEEMEKEFLLTYGETVEV